MMSSCPLGSLFIYNIESKNIKQKSKEWENMYFMQVKNPELFCCWWWMSWDFRIIRREEKIRLEERLALKVSMIWSSRKMHLAVRFSILILLPDMASGSYFATIDEFQVLSVFRPKINKANREYFREWWFSIGSVKSLIKKKTKPLEAVLRMTKVM